MPNTAASTKRTRSKQSLSNSIAPYSSPILAVQNQKSLVELVQEQDTRSPTASIVSSQMANTTTGALCVKKMEVSNDEMQLYIGMALCGAKDFDSHRSAELSHTTIDHLPSIARCGFLRGLLHLYYTIILLTPSPFQIAFPMKETCTFECYLYGLIDQFSLQNKHQLSKFASL